MNLVVVSRAMAALRVVDIAVRLGDWDEGAAGFPVARIPAVVGSASAFVERSTKAARLVTVGDVGND